MMLNGMNAAKAAAAYLLAHAMFKGRLFPLPERSPRRRARRSPRSSAASSAPCPSLPAAALAALRCSACSFFGFVGKEPLLKPARPPALADS